MKKVRIEKQAVKIFCKNSKISHTYNKLIHMRSDTKQNSDTKNAKSKSYVSQTRNLNKLLKKTLRENFIAIDGHTTEYRKTIATDLSLILP